MKLTKLVICFVMALSAICVTANGEIISAFDANTASVPFMFNYNPTAATISASSNVDLTVSVSGTLYEFDNALLTFNATETPSTMAIPGVGSLIHFAGTYSFEATPGDVIYSVTFTDATMFMPENGSTVSALSSSSSNPAETMNMVPGNNYAVTFGTAPHDSADFCFTLSGITGNDTAGYTALSSYSSTLLPEPATACLFVAGAVISLIKRRRR